MPATSAPSTAGSAGAIARPVRRILVSTGFTLVAITRTTTSPGPGDGIGPLARLQHLRAAEAVDLHDAHVGLLAVGAPR